MRGPPRGTRASAAQVAERAELVRSFVADRGASSGVKVARILLGSTLLFGEHLGQGGHFVWPIVREIVLLSGITAKFVEGLAPGTGRPAPRDDRAVPEAHC